MRRGGGDGRGREASGVARERAFGTRGDVARCAEDEHRGRAEGVAGRGGGSAARGGGDGEDRGEGVSARTSRGGPGGVPRARVRVGGRVARTRGRRRVGEGHDARRGGVRAVDDGRSGIREARGVVVLEKVFGIDVVVVVEGDAARRLVDLEALQLGAKQRFELLVREILEVLVVLLVGGWRRGRRRAAVPRRRRDLRHRTPHPGVRATSVRARRDL